MQREKKHQDELKSAALQINLNNSEKQRINKNKKPSKKYCEGTGAYFTCKYQEVEAVMAAEGRHL